jgi:hypothetical protein
VEAKARVRRLDVGHWLLALPDDREHLPYSLSARAPDLEHKSPFLFHLLVQTNFLTFILGVWDSLWLLFTVPEADSLDLWFYALALQVHFYAILVPDCQPGHLPFSACLVVGSAPKASGIWHWHLGFSTCLAEGLWQSQKALALARLGKALLRARH